MSIPLVEQDLFFRQIFYGSSVAVLVHKNGIIVKANEMACRILEVDEEEIEGKNVFDFVHPRSRDLVSFRIQRAVKFKKSGPAVREFILNSRREVRVCYVSSIPFGAGDDVYSVVLFHDLTDAEKDRIAGFYMSQIGQVEASRISEVFEMVLRGAVELSFADCGILTVNGRDVIRYGKEPDEIVDRISLEMSSSRNNWKVELRSGFSKFSSDDYRLLNRFVSFAFDRWESSLSYEELRLKSFALDRAGSAIAVAKIKNYRELEIVYVNDVVEKLTGFTKAELLNVNPTRILENYRDSDIPDLISRMEKHGFLRGRIVVRTKDGFNRYFIVSSSIIYNPSTGEPDYVVVSGEDVTGIEKLEREIGDLRKSLDQVSDMIIITDKRGFIRFVNYSLLDKFGVREEEIIGRHTKVFSKWVVSKNRKEVQRLVMKMRKMAEGVEIRNKFSMLDKDGKKFFADILISPFYEEEELRGFIGIIRDITREHTLEVRLKRFASKMRKDLEFAKDFQNRLNFFTIPRSENLIFSAFYMPCEDLSGDLMYVKRFSNGIIGVVVADVFGHGISVSMQSSFMKMMCERHYDALMQGEPHRFLKFINDDMVEHNLDIYVSMVAVAIDERGKEMKFASAGHPPILMLKDGRVFELKAHSDRSFVLGFSQSAVYPAGTVKLDYGMRFLLYTDCAYEVEGKNGVFNFEKLKETMRIGGNFDIEGFLRYLVDVLEVENGKLPLDDDLTLIGFDYVEPYRVHLEVENDMANLPEIIDVIKFNMEMYGFPRKDIFAVSFAVTEAFNNAYEYGNREDPSKRVFVDIKISGEEIVVVITDEGEGFDTSCIDSIDDVDLKDIITHRGRGIVFMKKYLDSVIYNDKGNSVTLVKKKSNVYPKIINLTPPASTGKFSIRRTKN